MKTRPRVLSPDRRQHVMEDGCLDQQLVADHRVRLVWAFVEALDVAALEAGIRSLPGHAGAPAIAPRLLLSLWLYACLDNVGSAREIERLCSEHMAYRWLCGRVGVNHHTLSDFRNRSGQYLDDLLSNMIASLVRAGVVDGTTICQDGTKIRASAGSGSFRREATLEDLRVRAGAHVARVKAQGEDPALASRVRAARDRAAREQEERVNQAIRCMAELKAVKARNVIKKGKQRVAEPRASTTDPEARVMKSGGGGTHAAYNVQFATDAKSRAILGVQVLRQPADCGMSEGMRPEVERRTGRKVRVHITDAGYISKPTIEREEQAGVQRILPLPTRADGQESAAHQPGDGPGVRRWRDRMRTQEAKALLRQRSGIAETPNGELKTYRAMGRLLVRGVAKATNVVLIGAIVYNLMHFASTLLGNPMPRL